MQFLHLTTVLHTSPALCNPVFFTLPFLADRRCGLLSTYRRRTEPRHRHKIGKDRACGGDILADRQSDTDRHTHHNTWQPCIKQNMYKEEFTENFDRFLEDGLNPPVDCTCIPFIQKSFSPYDCTINIDFY